MCQIFAFFAEPPVRLTRRNEVHEVQKLKDVMFDVSFCAKKLRRHVEKAEDCERLVAERSPYALITKRFPKKNLRRAGEGPDWSAVLYKKNIVIFYGADFNNRI